MKCVIMVIITLIHTSDGVAASVGDRPTCSSAGVCAEALVLAPLPAAACAAAVQQPAPSALSSHLSLRHFYPQLFLPLSTSMHHGSVRIMTRVTKDLLFKTHATHCRGRSARPAHGAVQSVSRLHLMTMLRLMRRPQTPSLSSQPDSASTPRA